MIEQNNNACLHAKQALFVYPTKERGATSKKDQHPSGKGEKQGYSEGLGRYGKRSAHL